MAADSGAARKTLSLLSQIAKPSLASSRLQEEYTDGELCQRCKNIVRIFSEGTSEWIKCQELLETEAESGCPMCLLFLNALSTKERENMRQHWQLSNGQEPSSEFYTAYSIHHQHVFMYHNVPHSEAISHQFLLSAKTSSLPSTATTVLTLNEPMSSTSSLTAAKEWLSTCLEQHGLCSAMHQFVPARLIDIGDSQLVQPRLCDDVQTNKGIKYMTLSHCWGDDMPMKLLRENLEKMKSGIILSQLSKTFQDAIRVTRSLGVRYLWIDALCIIQDSEDDWQQESARMNQTYSASFCNIAATAAPDGSKGLFLLTRSSPRAKFDRNGWGKASPCLP